MTKDNIRNMFKYDKDPWEILLKCVGINENPNTVNKVCFDPNDVSNVNYE